MYKLAKGPALCRPALAPIQTRAPGSTGTDARVGAPSRRDNLGISERNPQTQTQFCPTIATRRSVVQRWHFPSGVGPSAWPAQPNPTTVQLGSGKATNFASLPITYTTKTGHQSMPIYGNREKGRFDIITAALRHCRRRCLEAIAGRSAQST